MADDKLYVCSFLNIYNTFAYALKSLRTIFCLVNSQTISARLQLGLDPGLRNRKDLLIGARRFFHFPSSPPIPI